MLNNVIWVTGAEGRLGRCLVEALKASKFGTIIATDKDVDITDRTSLERAALIYKPTIVINCASLSDAQYCEEHRAEAYKVNALGARNVAIVSSLQNAKIIHFSTDDVFSGVNNRAKNEFDFATPKSVYGLSKFAGENFVRELNPKHLVIRSSWIYGLGNDFFQEVLAKADKGESFEVADDKIGTPTSINELVKCVIAVLAGSEYGIMHASCEGRCSRYEFAKKILELTGKDVSLAKPCKANSDGVVTSTELENLMLEITGDYKMPDWESCMEEYAKEYLGGKA